MPTLSYGPYHANTAQRVRYPNGTCSAPFIAHLGRTTMISFSKEILGGTWPLPPIPLDEHGRVKVEDLRRREANPVGSCRIELAFDGRYWSTLERWCREVSELVGPVGRRDRPDGCLSRGELLITFPEAREAGQWTIATDFGVEHPYRAVALTVLKWAKSIEEWDT